MYFYGLTYVHTQVNLFNVIFLQFNFPVKILHACEPSNNFAQIKRKTEGNSWMKKNAIQLKLPTLLLFIELTFISYFEKKMIFVVKLCIILLILLWNRKYAYTKTCERWVSIFNWLRLISAKSYDNYLLSIQLIVKTVPNVVMGTDGTLYRRSAYVSCIE